MKTITPLLRSSFALVLRNTLLYAGTRLRIVTSLTAYLMALTLTAQTPALEIETPLAENGCVLNHKVAIGLGRTLPLRTPAGVSFGIGLSQKLLGIKENSLYTSLEWNFSRQNKELVRESPELIYVHKNYQIMSFSVPLIYRQAFGGDRLNFLEGGAYVEYILPVQTSGSAIFQTVGDSLSLPAPPQTLLLRTSEDMESWNWGIHFAIGRTLNIGSQTFQLKWMVRGGSRRLDSGNDRLYHSFTQLNFGWNFR
jgi:hypothetical protein